MITFDQKIVEFMNTWTVGDNKWPIGNLFLCLIALVLCVILVGLIGIEREKRGRSAGLRTHLLVGVGSTIIMIISIYGFPIQDPEHRDVARLAAQIITGVGFLGAGAIIHRNSGIKGLTTAGTIWASMAIGIACGSFNFILGILGTVLIILILTIFRKIEAKIGKENPTIHLIVPIGEPVLYKILAISRKYDCMIQGINSVVVEDSNNQLIEITFQVVFSKGNDNINELVAELEKEIKPDSIHLLNHM